MERSQGGAARSAAGDMSGMGRPGPGPGANQRLNDAGARAWAGFERRSYPSVNQRHTPAPA